MCVRYIYSFVFLLAVATWAVGQSSDFEILSKAAQKGGANDQNKLGIAYSEGTGVRPDQKAAVFWFRKSAEQGYALGACNLGLHYGKGWGVKRDSTLMMKYVFSANALDGLKCNPTDFIDYFKPRPTECQLEVAWKSAVTWLRSHPDFKNSFGDRPWNGDNGQYPVTLRENAPSVNLPPKSKCGVKHSKR